MDELLKTIAKSIDSIAESFYRIADAKEREASRYGDYVNAQQQIADALKTLTKEE